MSVQNVVIFGGSGFVGQSLREQLALKGYSSFIPTRDKARMLSIQSNALIRAIQVTDLNQTEIDAIIKPLNPDDVVINLVGLLHSTHGVPYGPEFKEAHVDLPVRIMRAMKTYGIKRYIHMSALGADSQGPSMYLRSKGDSEMQVKHSDLDWTIFRPSVIFGQNDNFINMFGKLQTYFPVMPLAGSNNLFQPVAVTDVAKAFVESIQMPLTIGQSYDLAGPDVLTLSQIIQFAAKKQGVKRPVIPLPDWMGYIQAFVLEKMPGEPIMSRDNVASMKLPSILPKGQENALQVVFGIQPSPIESLLN